MQRLRTVTSLDVCAVAGHHAMPAALLFFYYIVIYIKASEALYWFHGCNVNVLCSVIYSDVVLFCFQSRRHKFDSGLVTCKIIKESLTNAAQRRFDGWMDG